MVLGSDGQSNFPLMEHTKINANNLSFHLLLPCPCGIESRERGCKGWPGDIAGTRKNGVCPRQLLSRSETLSEHKMWDCLTVLKSFEENIFVIDWMKGQMNKRGKQLDEQRGKEMQMWMEEWVLKEARCSSGSEENLAIDSPENLMEELHEPRAGTQHDKNQENV